MIVDDTSQNIEIEPLSHLTFSDKMTCHTLHFIITPVKTNKVCPPIFNACIYFFIDCLNENMFFFCLPSLQFIQMFKGLIIQFLNNLK